MDQRYSVFASRLKRFTPRLPITAAMLGCFVAFAPADADAQAGLCQVSQQRILQVMLSEREKGYDLRSTANGVRLQAAIILSFVRELSRADPERRPFWLGHDDYFRAYLTALDLTAQDAPAFARMAFENGENYVVDYRMERVIDSVRKGPQPNLAINVKAGWPISVNAAPSYTYEDTESSPPLRVTHDRINAYRVLTYEDVVVYDAIEGISGRATSGLLGLMFRAIGDGQAVSSRMAISEDGLQVTRTTARKGPIRVTQTATVQPNGLAERGLLPDRPDLERIEDRLKIPLRIDYMELDTQTLPAAPTEPCPDEL